MSYLTQYALRRPAATPAPPGVRVDERTTLNRPEFDGGAAVRVFVGDTSGCSTTRRRRDLPTPRLKLRISDCVHEVHLEFDIETPALRENSLHKIDTLIAALERFRSGLAAEAELRARREQHCRR